MKLKSIFNRILFRNFRYVTGHKYNYKKKDLDCGYEACSGRGRLKHLNQIYLDTFEDKFSSYLSGEIIDIGCGDASLEELLVNKY